MKRGLIHLWRGLFFGEVSVWRPRLFARLALGLLAFDCWLVMLPHGGRYGAGGFNVAHFAWLDALQPDPTRELYGLLILGSGALALVSALGPMRRWAIGLVTIMYSWAWAMSQLDSYQHHYLLSLVLICLLLSPALFSGPGPSRRPDWGWRTLMVTTSLVYAFTAVAKLGPGWRDGEVLRRIHQDGGALEVPMEWALELGLTLEQFFSVAGHLTVLLQVVISVAYLAVVLPQSLPGSRLIRWVGLVAALGFHLGSEVVNLRIGWFAWYMIGLALIALPPGDVSLGGAWWDRARDRWAAAGRVSEVVAWLAAILGIFAMASLVDLPGAWQAACLLGVCSGVLLTTSARAGSRRGPALAVLVAVVALTWGVGQTEGRYDYYRFVGGDALRRGELELAHEAYGRANTYAPPDRDRWKKVLQVRARLRDQPRGPRK